MCSLATGKSKGALWSAGRASRNTRIDHRAAAPRSLLIDTRSFLIDTRSLLIDTRSLLIDTRSLLIDTRSLMIHTLILILSHREQLAAIQELITALHVIGLFYPTDRSLLYYV